MSGGTGDVLTVAVGPLSGIVNTHFWNSTSAEDSKRNVLYQQAGTGKGKAVPRLVVVDWAGDMEIRKKWRLQDGMDGDDVMEEVEASTEEPSPPAEKLRTERWWSYMVPEAHEKTLNLIPERFARDHALHNCFGEGYGAYKDRAFREQFEDSVRYFFEGMDRCQGVNLTCDASGIFGGVAHSFISDFRDEYGRVPVWCNALFGQSNDELNEYKQPEGEPADFDKLKRWEQQGVNRAFSHTLLSEAADGYLPIDIPSWSKPGGFLTQNPRLVLNPANPVDTGAVVSAGITTALSPIFTGDMAFAHFCDVLRPVPCMKLSSLRLAMPLNVTMVGEGLNVQRVLEANPFEGYMPLSHLMPRGEDGRMMFGVKEVYTMSQIFSTRGLANIPQAGGVSVTQTANEFLSEVFKTGRTHSVFAPPYLLSSSFPLHILPPGLNVIGWADPAAPATYDDPSTVPTQLPTAAQLSTTCASALMLHSIAVRFKEANRARHLDQNVELDQWKEVQEALDAMVDEYDQGLIDRD